LSGANANRASPRNNRADEPTHGFWRLSARCEGIASHLLDGQTRNAARARRVSSGWSPLGRGCLWDRIRRAQCEPANQSLLGMVTGVTIEHSANRQIRVSLGWSPPGRGSRRNRIRRAQCEPANLIYGMVWQRGSVKPDGCVGPPARAPRIGEGDLRRDAAAARNLDFPCGAVVFMASIGWIDAVGHPGIVPHVKVERAGTWQWS
jgi:hypothetical protein